MSKRETDLTAAPVLSAERIASLDVLRGVAILGILVMNIYAFAMPFPEAYRNPLLMGGTDPLNMGTWFFTHVFFDLKFLSIFAMLFGAGIILMTGRAKEKGVKYGRIFYRRQLSMLLIGALHAYFIWIGDVLFLYAIVGMLAFLFRKRTPRSLIVIACLLLPITLLMSFGFAGLAAQTDIAIAEISAKQEAGISVTADEQRLLDRREQEQGYFPESAEAIRKDVDAHLGSYVQILRDRVPKAISMQVGVVILLSARVTALMLLGMALMKTGILAAERSAGFYRRMMFIAYAVGLPLTVFSAFDLHAHNFDNVYASQAGGLANYWGSLVVALGHIALVMLMIETAFARKLLQRLAAVGRMALSNYLMHSIILTTVFYGYGLGLYGSIPRFGQMGFVVAVIALQLLLSPWWLARYRFGPVEWLWRSLTYWKWLPMLR
jgi:uncharacterized protein